VHSRPKLDDIPAFGDLISSHRKENTMSITAERKTALIKEGRYTKLITSLGIRR
jgi:hypothetical protein